MSDTSLPWRRALYDRIAAASRAAPRLRGKGRLGWALTRALLPHGPTEVVASLKSGVRLHLDVSERFQSWIYWTGEHDEETIARMVSAVPADATVFDVGAHIGTYVTQIGHRLGAGCRLVAVEPRPPNLARLRENLRLNGLESRTAIVAAAVGDRPGQAWMQSLPGRRELTSDAAISAEDDGSVPVPVRTLDEIADQVGATQCDLIKLDVQGCELAALRGARRLLEAHRPVLNLEFSGYWMSRFGWSPHDLLELVAPFGYGLYREDGSQIDASSKSRGDAETIWGFANGGQPRAMGLAMNSSSSPSIGSSS